MAESEIRKDLTTEEFQLFRDWIHRHSGIFLEDIKADSLRISLVTRVTRLGVSDYRDYFELLAGDEEEFKALMNLVTINETSFFRFPAQFSVLRDKVITRILADRPRVAARRFRVWSAGCSTGEEPYTIGMTLLESELPALGYECEVLGTDVSTRALDRARAGVYPARSLANLEQHVIQRWFEPVPDGHRPVKAVRDLCDFHYHNLIKEPYPLAFMSGWDVIFCRNVTIYFRLESTRRVVDHFFEALNPGGYLFIGHSETLTSISDRFEIEEIDGVFLYRKPLPKKPLTFSEALAQRREAETAARQAGDHPRRSRIEVPARTMPPRRSIERPARVVEPPAPPVEPVAEGAPEEGDDLARAREMLESARAADALAIALDVLEREPSNVDAHLVAAFAHADLGQLDEAVTQVESVLAEHPLTAGARYILGVISQQRGDVDAALEHFRRTVYIDRDFVLAHFAIANIHRARGELADACREYENTLRALYLKPEGSWTAFLGGFRPDLLARSCERSLLECGRGI